MGSGRHLRVLEGGRVFKGFDLCLQDSYGDVQPAGGGDD